MSKINDLIEFLKLDRRFEEAEAKNQGVDYTKVTITTIDTNETSVVNRTEFENTNIYLRIVNQLDKYKPTDFYVLPLTDKSIYYIKIDDQIDGFNYLNLENNRCEKVDDEQLLQKIEIGFTTNQYFYDKNNREVVFSNEILEDVAVFGDRILFDPEKLDITTGTYSYSYSKPITTFCQFIDGIINIIKLFVTPFLYSGDKKKDLMVYVKQKGSIFLIPTISSIDDYFYATYYYTSSGKKMFYQINNPEDVAIQLEFKGKEPFLSFLNETIFTQENFNYLDDFENQRRIEFISKFKQLIIAPLEKEMNSNSETAFYDAMVTLYYLTDTIALTLSNETLWKLFETGISRNSLNNKGELEEENIYLKLLEAISNKETTKIAFLNRLLRKKGNTTTTYLEFLFNSIHGDNGTAFAKLVNKVWKQSRFVNPDPNQNEEFATTNGPIILPYKSEKCLGFYFSNAAVNFALNKDNETKLHVRFETGKYKEELRPALKSDRLEKVNVPIIADYDYHPFYPIYLKNVENQETSLKLDAIVPAFMLMANQSQQFWHNVIKTGEYGLDALTIASGIGNFRYLMLFEDINVTLGIVKFTAGTVEITSGITNILLKVTGREETEKTLQEYLFWLQLLSLSGEVTLAIKNGLQKTAKELIKSAESKASFEKELDNLVEEGKITQAEADDVIAHLEEVAEVERKLTNAWDNGKLLSERTLRKRIRTLLQEYKNFNLEIHIVDDIKDAERIADWNARNVLGSFKAGPLPKIFLRKEVTELTLQHEVWHLEDLKKLGSKKFQSTPNWEKEELVWERIWKTKERWTEEELVDSYKYYKETAKEEIGKWSSVKELEDLLEKPYYRYIRYKK